MARTRVLVLMVVVEMSGGPLSVPILLARRRFPLKEDDAVERVVASFCGSRPCPWSLQMPFCGEKLDSASGKDPYPPDNDVGRCSEGGGAISTKRMVTVFCLMWLEMCELLAAGTSEE